MNPELWTAVDSYINELVVQPDAALDEALAASAAAGLPAISVSPAQGKLLQILARSVQARRILELGTLGGYSAIWLGRTLPLGGRLITVESEPKHARVASANLERAGLTDRVTIIQGRAADALRQMVDRGGEPFDFVFIDADKASIPEYFELSLGLVRPGGIIVVDNVVRRGAVVDAASDDPNVRGVRRFNELLSRERRVTATTIQTVGSKGYDGLTIALVPAREST